LSLRVDDILQRGRIVERVTVKRPNMKGEKEGRTVLLHPDAKAALVTWLKQLEGDDLLTGHSYVFRSRQGHNQSISRQQAYTILSAVFDDCELAGQLGTHSMRKTFANHVYEKLGHALYRTQQAKGHRNFTSTVSCLSFRAENIDAAILAS
jgi:site-specific recombinase XerD